MDVKCIRAIVGFFIGISGGFAVTEGAVFLS